MSKTSSQAPLPMGGALPRLLTMANLPGETELSRTTLYNEIKAGRFPAPIHLSPRRRAWTAAAIQDWLQARQAGAAR